MQTFLPYKSFKKSAQCLDYKRLGKQRVEGMQILNAMKKTSGGWINHPATKMWKGYSKALKEYVNIMIDEWIERGYNNTMKKYRVRGVIKYPSWLGNKSFHNSHRSNLLRKDKNYYSKYGWNISDNLEYIWPGKEKKMKSSGSSVVRAAGL